MNVNSEIGVETFGAVTLIEIRRPPHNFSDLALVRQIADAMENCNNDQTCRTIVLAAQGKSFCAGANFSKNAAAGAPVAQPSRSTHIYEEALRLFRIEKPIVAAVQGAAIGAGLGLALVADFRVTCSEARFSTNFMRLGLHPGFGLTATLPELIGKNKAELMFYTGRRFTGEEALTMGLANRLVPLAEVRSASIRLAAEIAECAPLALLSTRATMRAGLAERVKAATDREIAEQTRLRGTEDFKEGTRAYSERRIPNFTGR